MTSELRMNGRHDTLVQALEDGSSRESLESQLPSHLQAQRWFGGRNRQLTKAAVERWIPIGTPPGVACLCIVTVEDASGRTTEHLLPLALGEPYDGDHKIVDALGIGAVRAELLRHALAGATLEGHLVSLSFERTEAGASACPGEGRLIGVEQSNTSIVYGDAAILKLYRRLEVGHNPEVELCTYLTSQGAFTAIPPVLATGRFSYADGYEADAVLVQEYVPNNGDGWAWALSAAGKALSTVKDSAAELNPDEMLNRLTRESGTLEGAASLGRATAQLHAALARGSSGGVRPEPATKEDVESWGGAVREEAASALRSLQQAGSNASPSRHPLEEALDQIAKDAMNLRVSDAGLKTRIHGDYHLGQALRTDRGWMIVDFEGEPVKYLAERRALQHPLVDVAGMLRSWNYAAFTAEHELNQGSPDTQRATSHAAAWEEAVRGYFLEAYLEEADKSQPRFLPRDRHDIRLLLALFQLRKALYEVQYERNNRPDWAWIPESAVQGLASDLLHHQS